MNKILKIAALVGAILLPLFVLAGTIISEIGLCKNQLWFAAVFFIIIFAFASVPIIKDVMWLIEKAKKQDVA